MSNASTHRAASGLDVFAYVATQEYLENGEISLMPFAAGGLATTAAKLPDILEPAFHNPNHRQFFHSLTFAGLIGYGLYELYQWQPQDDVEKFARFSGLVIWGSYLIHLICDAGTRKGLPILGKL